MCANCVAQGAVYVGGALTALQAMAYRAKVKRSAAGPEEPSPSGAADTASPLGEPAART